MNDEKDVGQYLKADINNINANMLSSGNLKSGSALNKRNGYSYGNLQLSQNNLMLGSAHSMASHTDIGGGGLTSRMLLESCMDGPTIVHQANFTITEKS